MPLSAVLFIVSVLSVIGIITIADALMRVILREKLNPETVILYLPENSDDIEYKLRCLAKKYPESKLIIKYGEKNKDTEKIFKILKRNYPNLSIHKIKNAAK